MKLGSRVRDLASEWGTNVNQLFVDAVVRLIEEHDELDPERLAKAMAIASGASVARMGPHWRPLGYRVAVEYERLLHGTDGQEGAA